MEKIIMGGLSFSVALGAIKDGEKVYRLGWNGKIQWLQLHKPEFGGRMTKAFICIRSVQGDFIPWTASQMDLLSEDWDYYRE